MQEKFQNHIASNFHFLKEKKLFLAVSGGLDSMVMLHLFQQLNFKIQVAHCNFCLRDSESDSDEIFVKKYCESNKIPSFIQKFDTKKFAKDQKLSIQEAARKLRYTWFEELLIQKNLDFVLTAHHLDDTVETFLIHLSRGTGLDGLTGIPERNNNIVRPLLPFSRLEIENYAKENKINWREDSSNSSDKYVRNKLRHDLIPILKSLNPSFLESFYNTIENLKQSQSLVDDASRIVYRKVVEDAENQKKINLNELLQLENHKAYLYQWLQPFGFSAWNDIYDLVQAQSGKQILSTYYRLIKDRNELLLEPISEKNKSIYYIENNQKSIEIPIKLTFSKVNSISETDSKIIFVDKDSLKFPLLLRKWQEGDYFYPFGMNGSKKVSKFFKDDKMSLIEKEASWLLCSEDKIVWIVGKRQDNRFKINENTTELLKIEIS